MIYYDYLFGDNKLEPNGANIMAAGERGLTLYYWEFSR